MLWAQSTTWGYTAKEKKYLNQLGYQTVTTDSAEMVPGASMQGEGEVREFCTPVSLELG